MSANEAGKYVAQSFVLTASTADSASLNVPPLSQPPGTSGEPDTGEPGMSKKRSSMLMNYQPPEWPSHGTSLGMAPSSPRNNRATKLMNMTMSAADPVFPQQAKAQKPKPVAPV